MTNKPHLKSNRMRIIRLSGLLLTAVLVLAGCQRHEAAVSLEQPLAPVIATVLAQVEAPAAAEEAGPPADECLKCHSDKDQLIETADPVEGATEI